MKAKLIHTFQGKSFYLADEKRKIYCLDGAYVDINGNEVEVEPSFKPRWEDDDEEYDDDDEEKWHSAWINDEGLDEKLISKTTKEIEWEIDDGFGNFGFINRAGEFVIEPQYAWAHEFTYGLAAVNLNRTWYKTEDGRRFYENHYGYIDHLGKAVIPFAYDEAYPFNKYGVAVVHKTDWIGRLIDSQGECIPGTEKMDFEHYYDYDSRFLEFTYINQNDKDSDKPVVGVYDTKERKVIIEPSVDSIIECDEDKILVYLRDGEMGVSDFHQYYINSNGDIIYPWLYGKGFATVEVPNMHDIAIVAVSKYTELTGNPSSFFEYGGKKYEREFMHGLYSSEEKFLLPMEYEDIEEIDENLFACKKEETIYLYQVEEE